MASSTTGAAPEPTVDARSSARAGGHDLTFLFTDVEGSTRLWEQRPDAMRAALERHDVILRTAIATEAGEVVKATGDGMMAVFATPAAAVSGALRAQEELVAEAWPDGCTIRVRMGIHVGDADRRGGDFFGPTVNRTARIMAAGHGGQVLLSRSAAETVGDDLPANVSLRDLGEHRLKDLERPERLFQLVHPALAREFPPVTTLDRRPNNLPTQASVFVGREGELASIRGRLDDPTVRLLTLTGPGGTGKTRLALRAAAEQIDRFGDGVFFVDLASATDTDAVLALIVTALGIADAADGSPLDELRRHLRDRHVLLVLDTFEQVTIAASALAELLDDCPRLKLLVTSREALRVRAEHVVAVPPLSLPDLRGGTSAEDLGQFEAIQLFVERARTVRADFHLTDDNAAAVAEICRRLDGLPLAIELATARLNLFSPEALRDRLGSRLKLLGGGARDLPARQQTLRATIDWSYQLLEPAEQRLLELMAVFATATIEAIEAVAAGVGEATGEDLDPLDGLGSLLDKSLLRHTDGSGEGPTRVVMLETIREYATEQLESHDDYAVACRDRHARYFARSTADAWSAASDEDDVALRLLTADLDNLRLAWNHWVGRRDLDRLDELLDGLWRIYESRGWYHATIGLITDLLGVLATMPPSDERWQREVTLRTSRARALTMLRGYTGEVEDAYLEALALFEGHPEVPQLYPVLRSLGSFHGFRGEFEKAAVYARDVLRLGTERGDPIMVVDGEFLVGSYTAFIGDPEGGLRHLDAAITASEHAAFRPRRLRLGVDPRVSCLTTSGFLLWMLGFPDRAVERSDRGVALATELDHPYSEAYALFHSGFVHVWRGEPEVVANRARAAIAVAEASDLPIWRALGTCLLGAATSGLGDPAAGTRQIEDGIDQYRGLRTPPVFWPFLRFLHASAHAEAGSTETGLALIDEAVHIGGADQLFSPLLHTVRGDLLRGAAKPDVTAAITAYAQGFDVAERFGSRLFALRAAVRLCGVTSGPDRERWVERVRALYEAVTEGRATPDLAAAAEVLAEAGR